MYCYLEFFPNSTKAVARQRLRSAPLRPLWLFWRGFHGEGAFSRREGSWACLRGVMVLAVILVIVIVTIQLEPIAP